VAESIKFRNRVLFPDLFLGLVLGLHHEKVVKHQRGETVGSEEEQQWSRVPLQEVVGEDREQDYYQGGRDPVCGSHEGHHWRLHNLGDREPDDGPQRHPEVAHEDKEASNDQLFA
jgi:hypothetical protein